MDHDQQYVVGTASVIVGLVLARAFRRDFDPFAPIWLFLTGYFHVYVIQATMHRDWAINVRGVDVTTAANARAFWALLWFLAVYYSGIGKVIAGRLPRAPRSWSPGIVMTLVPLLVGWGLASAWLVLRRWSGDDPNLMSSEQRLMLQFPTMQLVAGILLIVTGRQPNRPRPALTMAGLAITLSYTLIWMYFGKRSHSLFGILTAFAAWYLPRYRRPSIGTIATAAGIGCLVVAVAIGWRIQHNRSKEGGIDTFLEFVTTFDPSEILVSLNLKESTNTQGMPLRYAMSHETKEYGGFLLMMDTVPHKSDYDYGANYLRLFSTWIPRPLWPEKPLFGRDQWKAAWMAGSEFKRDEKFTGPAIGILGATQLNGGAIGTLIVLAVVALVIRSGYDYFRYHADTPWAQAWWALTYFNAWLMTVNDDPAIWFYYLYGHTIFAPMVMLWVVHRVTEATR
ncbi:hypothetical protein [Tautonia rosea]|uniref:hypothetical protein n=1 Tax=Tautonia rosea TaxID=2728037 RepID=UPI001475FBFC|nr:hypothetical protein [Tautonia rosea]